MTEYKIFRTPGVFHQLDLHFYGTAQRFKSILAFRHSGWRGRDSRCLSAVLIS